MLGRRAALHSGMARALELAPVPDEGTCSSIVISGLVHGRVSTDPLPSANKNRAA